MKFVLHISHVSRLKVLMVTELRHFVVDYEEHLNHAVEACEETCVPFCTRAHFRSLISRGPARRC